MKQLYPYVVVIVLQLLSHYSLAQQANLIKDVRPGNQGSDIKELVVMNGIVYFTADDGIHGRELWRSDGTANGTYMVKDINPGSGQSFINSLTVMNGRIYFAAYERNNGGELWRSDGTANGTVLVEDENPGGGGIDPISLTNANGTLYFVGNALADKKTVYRSNGNNVEEVTAFTDQAGFEVEIVGYNNNYIFIDVYEASSNGDILYSVDINSKAVSLVLGNQGPNGSASIESFLLFNNKLYFYVNGYIYGRAYSYDGINLEVINNNIYFLPATPTWRGTPVGFSEFGNKLIIKHENFDEQLGGPISSYLLTLEEGSNNAVSFKGIANARIYNHANASLNGIFYFGLSDFDSDIVTITYGSSYLYRTDGTADGTYSLKTLSSDGSKFITEMAEADGKLFFTTHSDAAGDELWVSDGTENGTRIVADIRPGNQGSDPGELTGLGKTLFFTADNGSNGRELWKYAPEQPNSPPTSSNSTINTEEDKVYTFSLEAFPFNDTNDGDALYKIRLNQLASNGTLFFDANNNNQPDGNELMANGWEVFAEDFDQLKYIPEKDANGNAYATFLFQVNDGKVYSNNEYTMTFNVEPINDAPSFSLKQTEVESDENEGTITVEGFALDISAGASNESEQDLNFNIEMTQKDATLSFTNTPSISNNGILTFQTETNTYGSATFEVYLMDDGSSSGDNENKSDVQSFKIIVNEIIVIEGKPIVNDAETTVNEAVENIKILPNASSKASTNYFQISNIENGTLSTNDGTELTNGYFITVAQGEAGLIFTPLQNSLETGSFDVQAASAPNTEGLGGEVATSSITVKKGQAEIELMNLQQTYDGNPKNINVTTNPEGLDYSITYNGESSSPTEAGTYEVKVTVTDDLFEGTVTKDFEILPAKAEITISNTIQNFDNSEKSVTISTTPEGLNYSVLYNDKEDLPVAVGEYEVLVKIEESNYIGEAEATLIIEEQPVIIQIENTEQVYDGSAKSVSVTTNPTGLPITITYNETEEAPINAGTYNVLVETEQFGFTYTKEAVLTILQAEAEIKISNTTQAFDNTEKSITVNTVPEGLEFSVLYNGKETLPIDAGTYEVLVKINEANYKGEKTATLEIEDKPVVIQIENLEQEYDGSAKSVSVTTIPTGLPIEVTYNGEEILPINAGSYNILVTVEQFGIEYTKEATLIITPAKAEIIVSDLEQVYDGSSKEVAITTTPAGLGFKVLYDNSVESPINAGVYSFEVVLEDDNYTGSYEGQLNIKKAEAEILLSNLTYFYDGNPKSATIETIPTGLDVQVLYDGNTVLPIEIGEYQIEVIINEDNYRGEIKENFRIVEESVEITVVDSVVEFNDGTIEIKVNTFPNDIPLDITYNGSKEKPVNAGTYQVVITAELNGKTYTKETTLIIEKKNVVISFLDTVQVYDGTLKALVVQTEPQGLAYTITYNNQVETPVNAGSYNYRLVIEEENYKGDKSGIFMIEKAQGSITLNQKEYVFSGKEIELDFSTEPSDLQVDFTFNGNSEKPLAIGDYLLEAEINELNYKGSLTDTLRIMEVTGISDQDLLVSMSVYPNPTGGELLIEDNAENKKQASIILYDASGKYINSWFKPSFTNKFRIDFSEQPTGIYMIHYIKNQKHAVFNVLKQ